MRIRTDLPRQVRVIDHVWIPLSNGMRLGARVWLPTDAESDPVPAVLEYLPYRKGDRTWPRDTPRHTHLAAHGYAAVRVDIRGSGESDGVLLDEYHATELEDGLEVLAWIAEQPWCTGAVGMVGISWGGFNGLQLAALRPPQLRAVISVCASDDRYADDVHYKGGSLLALEMLPWATTMAAFNGTPPDPAVVGERWREMWFERLQDAPLYIEPWLGHQQRDDYWRHGSVCEDFSAIECPVYAVSGWDDGYTDAVLRLVSGLRCPRRGLIGPWSHLYPDIAVPGPAIGFLQESLRWWDQWLKGIDTGVMDEPIVRLWLQEPESPAPSHAEHPGRWIAEGEWPSPRISTRRLLLDQNVLVDEPSGDDVRLDIASPQTCGLDAGVWCGDGGSGDSPLDQRADDGLALCFTSAPLGERLEVVGHARAVLDLASDRPLANVAVRLCAVSPDGTSALIARGILNLAHRESHEHPEPLVPGQRYRVSVEMDATARAVDAGQRLRLAVSPTYWPWIWPAPEPVTLSVFTAGSALELPVRPPQADDAQLRPFEEPESAPPLAVVSVSSGADILAVRRDLATGVTEVHFDWAMGGRQRLVDTGVEREQTMTTIYSIADDDPLSARVTSTTSSALGRGDWQPRVEVRSVMDADAQAFHVTTSIDAYEGDTRVFGRAETFDIPRRYL